MTAIPSGPLPAVDPATRELEEERDFLLRSLADLEAEHDAHDIDDVDYQTLKEDYTARAAAVLRALEPPPDRTVESGRSVEPGPSVEPGHSVESGRSAEPGSPAEPESLAESSAADETPSLAESSADAETPATLETSWAAGSSGAAVAAAGPRARPSFVSRHRRELLSVVGVVLVVGGVLWAVVASSSQRQAGQTISGQQAGVTQPIDSKETKLLLAAQQAADRGDNVTELKDAQTILAGDPTQPQALTMEGWLLAETGQKALVSKGLGLLALAEEVDPGFAQPHVYRGIALLSQGDNRAAVPELRWYLAHKPDPKLAPKVRAALAKAEANIATSKQR